MRRRLTILMCADLVGYSALMGRDESLAVASVQELRRDHLEPVAANYGGEVLKRMGDGWIISFPGVEAALDCAEEVQTRLVDHDVIKLRIGCHIGEIVEDDADFYGNGVNIAQRIETEAPPGGAMFSEDMFRQLSETRQQELRDAGVFKLKNIAQPIRLYQWRPANLTTAPDAGSLPSIAIETITVAPVSEANTALALDLHDGLIQHSMRRTGITTIDAAQEPDTPSVFLLRGRLRIAGERGRFMLTLLMRETMNTIWSGTYEGDTSDPFAFFDEVLASASADVRLQTIQHDGLRLAHLSDDRLSVSELRARAANMFFRQTHEDAELGYAALERAVVLSPRDGMALAMRAQTRMNRWAVQYDPDDQALFDWIGRDLDTAVAESPNSDFVFWARGSYRLKMLRDLEAAKQDMAHAFEVNPSFLGVGDMQAQISLLEGDYDGALKALEDYSFKGSSDPFKINRLSIAARINLATGRYDEAVGFAREAADLKPNDRGLQLLKALACDKAEDVDGHAMARTAALSLEKIPSLHTARLTLPPSAQWINDALHPEAAPV